MNLDGKYWDRRWMQGQTGWDTGSVTDPLKQYLDQLKDKDLRILIPGAGNAYEALYLFQNGFTQVYVCDISDEPLKNIRRNCPTYPSEFLLKGDFFSLNTDDLGGEFDLIIEQTFFCALDPSFRKEYFRKVHGLLKKGGKLVGVLFDRNFEVSPPFGGSASEYKTYFEPYFDIKVYEPCRNSIAPRAGTEYFIHLVRK